MRQYLHTSIVILCLLSVHAPAQWSGAWSNYFATETMAAECQSGRVERCKAAGLALYNRGPEWTDAIVGKNYTKLTSVKADLKGLVSWSTSKIGYVKPICTNASAMAVDSNVMFWTNEAEFCVSAGVPTNFFDETPYFKTQYPSVSNGWWGVRRVEETMRFYCWDSYYTYPGCFDYDPGTLYHWYGNSTSSLAQAYSIAASSSPMLSTNLFYGSSALVEGNGGAGNYYFDAYRVSDRIAFISTLTNYDSHFIVYASVLPGLFFEGVFDSQGDAVSTNAFVATNWVQYAGTSTGIWFEVNTVAPSVFPANYDQIDLTEVIVQGWNWMYLGNQTIRDYCFPGLTNGFKYK